MVTMYLASGDGMLDAEGPHLVAWAGEVESARMPIGRVESVILQGRAGITPRAVSACLKAEVPVALLDGRGGYRGRLEPPSHDVAATLRAQLRFMEDDARCLAVARAIVEAKLRNGATTLRRWGFPEASAAMGNEAKGASVANDMDHLRGHEGAGAAVYFRAFGARVGATWPFESRRAHPPVGPVNAALSYAYTLLFVRVSGAVRAAGLSPYVGCFHADREGHATLASDLMEEWRALTADRAVARLLRSGAITPADFEAQDKGTVMNKAARRALLGFWESTLDDEVTPAWGPGRMPARMAIIQQAIAFARHVRSPDVVPYLPMRVR